MQHVGRDTNRKNMLIVAKKAGDEAPSLKLRRRVGGASSLKDPLLAYQGAVKG